MKSGYSAVGETGSTDIDYPQVKPMFQISCYFLRVSQASHRMWAPTLSLSSRERGGEGDKEHLSIKFLVSLGRFFSFNCNMNEEKIGYTNGVVYLSQDVCFKL